MKKLKLDLDHLSVESFAADSAGKTGGTVRGHISLHCDPTAPESCYYGMTCDGQQSCGCPEDSADTLCYAC